MIGTALSPRKARFHFAIDTRGIDGDDNNSLQVKSIFVLNWDPCIQSFGSFLPFDFILRRFRFRGMDSIHKDEPEMDAEAE